MMRKLEVLMAVSLLRRGNLLFLGIRLDQKYGTAAIAMADGDEIRACQIGHLLATTTYGLLDGRWRRKQEYSWVRMDTGGGRKGADQLERWGWTAAHCYPGSGRHVEICIVIPEAGLRLAFATQGGKGKAPHWPTGMDDEFVRGALRGEHNPETVAFEPETWALIEFPAAPKPAPRPARVTSDAPLRGSWRVKEIRYVWEGGQAPIPDPLPGRFIFADGSYSMVWHHQFVRQADCATPWRPTDEERIAGYDGIVVNAGRYELRGDTLITRPAVAKTVEFEGGEARWIWDAIADTLWLESAEIWNHRGEMDPAVGEMKTELRCERNR